VLLSTSKTGILWITRLLLTNQIELQKRKKGILFCAGEASKLAGTTPDLEICLLTEQRLLFIAIQYGLGWASTRDMNEDIFLWLLEQGRQISGEGKTEKVNNNSQEPKLAAPREALLDFDQDGTPVEIIEEII